MATDRGFGRNAGSRVIEMTENGVMEMPDDDSHGPLSEEDGLLESVDWARPGLIDESRRGRRPRPLRWWAWRLAIPLLLLLGAAIVYSVLRVETDIELAAEQILQDEGIDTSTLAFEADFRDVVVSGTLPKGVDADQVQRLLEAGTGPGGEDIRSARVTAEKLLGAIDVRADSDGASITLSGSVPDSAYEATLLAAAGEAGVPVTDALTVVDRDASAVDPEGQIRSLAALLPWLGPTVTGGSLTLDDDRLVGSIEAVDPATRARIAEAASPGVEVTSLGNLDTMITFDGARVVLDGEVLSDGQAAALADAANSAVGAANVVNNLDVLGVGEAVPGADGKIDGLATLVRSFPNFNFADVAMNDTALTVNGEAYDPDALVPIDAAIAGLSASGLQSGGDITLGFELTLQEEIDLLQAELDALQDEIRENVRFDTDSDGLSELAGITLDKVVDAMNRFTRPVVEVGGHTDSQGNDAYNEALSQQRSDTVVAYLLDRGIVEERLNSVGYGETQPVADNETEEGRQENRRVSFTARESF